MQRHKFRSAKSAQGALACSASSICV
jgi:hypothetical protein